MTTQANDEAIESVYAHAAGRLENGEPPEQVALALQQYGVPKAAAATVVNQLVEARREAAKKAMLSGALWCVGGLLVTALTYEIAEPGGTYMVAYGAVIFGAWQFLRGLWRSR